MVKGKTFRSIVFLGNSLKETLDVKDNISTISSVKVFQTQNVDEVQQIISMSRKTAVIIDASSFLESIGQRKIAGNFKYYYLDWKNTKRPESIIEKIELYLFGKINIFKQGLYVEPEVETITSQHFFTLLEFKKEGWKPVISSHEKMENISEIIGKNWDSFLNEIIISGHQIKNMKEIFLDTTSYYEVIFPVIQNEKIQRICIIHVNIKEEVEEIIKKTKSFLASITT